MPSPKDTGGPVNKTGPNKGKNRSRNNDGTWRKKRNDTGKSRDKKKSGCFLTTVAFRYQGLPDNCSQLEKMRDFRDSHLMQSPEGRKLINDYYEIAPLIASKLQRESDLEYVWKEVNLCVALLENHDYSGAVTSYTKMVKEIERRVSLESIR